MQLLRLLRRARFQHAVAEKLPWDALGLSFTLPSRRDVLRDNQFCELLDPIGGQGSRLSNRFVAADLGEDLAVDGHHQSVIFNVGLNVE